MPLGPEDVIRKSFTTTRFKPGYDPEEVDSFLEEVVADLRRREREKEELLVQLQRPSAERLQDERLAREREQLDVIRKERQELVDELRSLSLQLDQASAELAQEQHGADAKSTDARTAAPGDLTP